MNPLFLIFGATGDLTNKKLIPALYKLNSKNLLPHNFAIVGIARREKTHEEFRKDIKEILKAKENKELDDFLSKIYYFRNDFDTEDSYAEMKNFFIELDKKHNTKDRLFYLATKPEHFENIVRNLKKNNCIDRTSGKTHRIIIEKPFGYDLKSAKELNKKLNLLFKEDEIFRIDHYLGKESVQNLFALRFTNRIFESVWNSSNIEDIQITVAENIGIENRGNYYDSYGALKDMVQNHLLQLLSITAMEPPKKFSNGAIKDEKIKVLKKVKVHDAVFGQYTGEPSYINEKGVAKNSKTETYAALKITIENKRWKNTPFYLRTGKCLKRKASEIVITFKKSIFDATNNVLVIRLQPNEGIYLKFNAKQPGNEFKLQEVSMDFCHECLFGINTPEAYEKLLYDALNGDTSLFTRWDEVEACWKIIDKIKKSKVVLYESGTWGPKEADHMLAKDDKKWREPI